MTRIELCNTVDAARKTGTPVVMLSSEQLLEIGTFMRLLDQEKLEKDTLIALGQMFSDVRFHRALGDA